MDLVTMWVVIFAVGIGTMTFGSTIVSKIGSLISKSSEKTAKRKRIKPLSKKEKEQRQKQREAKYRPIRTYEKQFTNIKTKEPISVTVYEYTKFDIKKDKVYKGIIKRPGKKDEAIYIFQPRVTFANGVNAGPLMDNGALSNKLTYLHKSKGEYSEAYFEKREICSQVQFDFTEGDRYITTDYLLPFLKVELPRDKKGNFIPVDLSDKKELEALQSYIVKHNSNGIDTVSYFESMIQDAKDAYDVDLKQKTDKLDTGFDGTVRVQKKQEEKEETQSETATDKAIAEYRREIANKERAYDYRYVTDGEPDDPLAMRVSSGRPRGGMAPGPRGQHGGVPR